MDQTDQKLLRQREAQCSQENPPGCTSGCPVHVDVRGMVDAVCKKEYEKGLALYQRALPFPGIISRICDQPCRKQCRRSELDEAVFVRAVEQICVAKNPVNVALKPLPLKNKKAAVVGAGLSGLTAAFELARKGYAVEIFEATERLGGLIWLSSKQTLPEQVIDNDFSVFAKLPVTMHYHTTITALEPLLQEFDAVYLATGAQLLWKQDGTTDRNKREALAVDPLTLATNLPTVFAGGSLRGESRSYSPIASIADGKKAATSIDRLFQGASLSANRELEGPYATSLYTNIEGVPAEPMVRPSGADGGYTEQDALKEAQRCLLCECLECVKVCEYLAHYRSYPKRYVREIYNNLSIVMGIHRANKMINSCSLCGLCERVCPGNLNMGEICLKARRMMVDKGKMPLSTHDFALRDMQFSNSEHCALSRHQAGFASSRYLFFPGCQLAASSPQQVRQAYAFLTETLSGGVGLMLGCCGAPANWAGQEAVFEAATQNLALKWRELGKPRVITACPSCHSLFKQHLPEATLESLWTVFAEHGLTEALPPLAPPKTLAVHDSCAARLEKTMQDSVRSIAAQRGFTIEELPLNREHTTCCSYGGLLIHANKEVAQKAIQRRIGESEADYLTYCSMCRDHFASQGKRAYHVLDLVFNDGADERAVKMGPGYSQRQENREKLKIAFLKEVWGESVEEAQTEVKLIIPESVSAVMEERMILASDAAKVIAHAESSKERLTNQESGNFIAYRQLGAVTYWVEYVVENDAFLVRNAYCHRINITE
ncbi:pyridine nucleotide-disulfide oxidoreductase/dicluster-binding protein [Azotosporobacter soli]|uniref:pyridine nucleotide-disulfide oxidoreductase/dicluster-binding protein n=1 Tax=Azotosporobacter soli TaxID=3055040 RepID=UPI0031FE81D6